MRWSESVEYTLASFGTSSFLMKAMLSSSDHFLVMIVAISSIRVSILNRYTRTPVAISSSSSLLIRLRFSISSLPRGNILAMIREMSLFAGIADLRMLVWSSLSRTR